MHYSDILKQEMEGTTRKYSLRGFAKKLEVSPSFLSLLLNGKRKLSLDRAWSFAKKLSLSGQKKRLFLLLVQKEILETDEAKLEVDAEIHGILSQGPLPQEIRSDAFTSIASWYHHAILSLLTCNNRPKSIEGFAKRLNITPQEIEQALERLERLKLIKKESNGYTRTNDLQTVFPKAPSESVRSYHRGVLKRAHEAITTQPMDERHFISLTLSMDPERLSLAKKRLDALIHELYNLFSEGTHSRVYQVSMQLFSLDQAEE